MFFFPKALSFIIPGVKIGVESLPRSESSLLSVQLGGLFLRDLTTQGSVFPVLVSPKPVKFPEFLFVCIHFHSSPFLVVQGLNCPYAFLCLEPNSAFWAEQ